MKYKTCRPCSISLKLEMLKAEAEICMFELIVYQQKKLLFYINKN